MPATLKSLQIRKTARMVFGFIFLALPLLNNSGVAQDKPKVSNPKSLPEDVARLFAKHGLKITAGNLTLEIDNEITKEVKELAKSKKLLASAEHARLSTENDLNAIRKRIAELRARYTVLSAQLANVSDVVTNNRLVGELNATKGLIDGLTDQQTSTMENARTVRSKFNESQESLAADKTLVEAVEKASEQTGQKLALKPSGTLALSDKQLKKYEDSVISESMPLEAEEGRLWINVSINGKPAEKMILDSANTAMTLSKDLAESLGIPTKESDPPVAVTLVDGREIPGRLVTLDTVRVGKFTAENVECVVLGEQAVEARPMLGLSFLSKFKFEIDANRAELRLVRIDSNESSPGASMPKKKGR
jgi:aspartyl protease family protein